MPISLGRRSALGNGITSRNDGHERPCGAVVAVASCPTRDHAARPSTCRLCAGESSTASPGPEETPGPGRSLPLAARLRLISRPPQRRLHPRVRTAVTPVWTSRSSVGRGGAPVARRIVAALPRNQAGVVLACRALMRGAPRAPGIGPSPTGSRDHSSAPARPHNGTPRSRGTAVTGLIPQQRERLGEDASFVNRPRSLQASGSNIAVLAGKDATDWARLFRSLATTSRYVSDKLVPGSSPAS